MTNKEDFQLDDETERRIRRVFEGNKVNANSVEVIFLRTRIRELLAQRTEECARIVNQSVGGYLIDKHEVVARIRSLTPTEK